MRKLGVFLFFLFTVLMYAEGDVLVSANGKSLVKVDKKSFKIKDFYPDFMKKDFPSVNDIELGVIINNKLLKIKDLNPKVNYMKGTGIIQISSETDRIKINTYIYSSIENKEKSFSIVNEVITDDVKDKVDVKFYYYISTKYENSHVYFDNIKNTYSENDMTIKSMDNQKSNLYITDDESFRILKLKKIYENEKKIQKEKLLLVDDIGKMGQFENRRDIVIFSGESEIKTKSKEAKVLLDSEIDSWNYVTRNISLNNFTKNEQELILQNIVFIKMGQLENGAVVDLLGAEQSSEIKTQDMLYAAMAFYKTENYYETKRILDYMINSYNNKPDKSKAETIVASYGYNNEDRTEKIKIVKNEELVSFYNSALFLEVLSEYMAKTGDYSYIKDYYRQITENLSERLYERIVNGMIEADYGNISLGYEEKRHYIATQNRVYGAFTKFSEQMKYFAPAEFVEKYQKMAKELKNKIMVSFLSTESILYSNYEDKNYSPFDVECFDTDLISDKKIMEKNLNYLLGKYKIYGMAGYSEKTGDTRDNVELELKILEVLFKNGYTERAIELQSRLEKIFINNMDIIPEYIKNAEKTNKYTGDGIKIRLAAKYIIMVYEKK